MSELAASVNASETLWTVDEVPDPEFGFYTVGSEIVQVIAGFPGSDPGYAVGQTFPSKIRVIRATNGTTAATHAQGVALTAANAFAGGASNVPDPATGDDDDVVQVQSGAYVLAPVGGGIQTVSLLGPFEMTFVQANGAYVSLATISAGVIVVVAFARVTADFDQEVTLTIGIGSTLDPEDNHGLTVIEHLQYFNEFWGADFGYSKNAAFNTVKLGFAITDADLVTALEPTGTPPTTGTLAVYALIVVPS